MPLALNVRRLGISFGRKSHDREVRKDKTYHARPFFNFSWFSSSKTKEINRPPTPTPHSFLQGSSSQPLKRRNSRKHLNSSKPPSQAPGEARPSVESDVGNDDEYVGATEISEEEKAQLNNFARGLKEMMEQLRRAEEIVDLPPTKTADGTPLPTIEEEDEPLSLVNSPLASPRLLPSIHAGATVYTNMSPCHEPASLPVPEHQSPIVTSQHHEPLAPTPHELPHPLPHPLPGAPPEDRFNLDVDQEDLTFSFGDTPLSLLACSSESEDEELGLTSDDSVLCLQSLLVLPPTHDTDMPATPTPTFESSSYFSVPIPLSKPLSRSHLQQIHPRPRNPEPQALSRPSSVSVSLLPISLFARPLSTATATDLDSPLEEEESGESDSVPDGERVLAREADEEMKGGDEESDDEEEEEMEDAANASPSKQIAVMRSKLGEIRKRLTELTEYSESSGVVLPSATETEEKVEKMDNALGRAESNDELIRSLGRLTLEKNRLERAVTDAELEKARLKEQNTLLLQTMDLTWEVTRQQLRDQDDQMEDLKTQIEGLQSALRELAEFSASPVDPIDPSVAGRAAGPSASSSSYGLRRKYRLEHPRSTKSSSTAATAAAPPSFLSADPHIHPHSRLEVQLTTPPATPSRGESALLDSADLGLGTGMSASFLLPTVSGQEVPSTRLGLGLAPASGPARSGSWHGRVRRNEARRAGARTVFQVVRDTGDDNEYDEDDDDDDDDIVLGGGRCQIKRRAGSMDLKSISSAWGVGSISQPRHNLIRRGLGLTT